MQEGADVRIEGPIPTAIQQAAQVISRLIPQRRALADSGLFEAQPIVPRDAWLEGVVNAVIHRSYSLAGDHIRVEIYPDRVQIVLPQDFQLPPGGLNIRWPDAVLEQEARMSNYKWYAALAYARANKLNRIVWDSPRARIGIRIWSTDVSSQ